MKFFAQNIANSEMKTLLFALTTIVNAQRYCNVVSDCPIGQQCVNFGFGGRICQMPAVGQGAQVRQKFLDVPINRGNLAQKILN
jgi:hypothetical protein